MIIDYSKLHHSKDFLRQVIIDCVINNENVDTAIKKNMSQNVPNKGLHEFNIMLTIEGEEVDVQKLFNKYEKEFDSKFNIKINSDNIVSPRFEKWKAKYISKESNNAKLETIKNNQRKVRQILENNARILEEINK